jgi:hypothetical protein
MKKHMTLRNLYDLKNMKWMRFELNQKANPKQYIINQQQTFIVLSSELVQTNFPS